MGSGILVFLVIAVCVVLVTIAVLYIKRGTKTSDGVNRASNNRTNNNRANTERRLRDYHIIDIPRNANSGIRHYDQEYYLTQEMLSNQQSSRRSEEYALTHDTTSNQQSTSELEDVLIPPPSYQDHKKDIRLPNDA